MFSVIKRLRINDFVPKKIPNLEKGTNQVKAKIFQQTHQTKIRKQTSRLILFPTNFTTTYAAQNTNVPHYTRKYS